MLLYTNCICEYLFGHKAEDKLYKYHPPTQAVPWHKKGTPRIMKDSLPVLPAYISQKIIQPPSEYHIHKFHNHARHYTDAIQKKQNPQILPAVIIYFQ